MKYLWWFVGIVTICILSIYTILFTVFGNDIVRPILEEQVNSNTKYDVKIDEFTLNINEIFLKVNVDSSHIFLIEGTHSILKRSVDVVINSKVIDGNIAIK
ncbi:hypothetical protein N9A28_08035, partial [Sulfurimonas sp.]|nr:hypothetical protein [Sulfurimonas sp.]